MSINNVCWHIIMVDNFPKIHLINNYKLHTFVMVVELKVASIK